MRVNEIERYPLMSYPCGLSSTTRHHGFSCATYQLGRRSYPRWSCTLGGTKRVYPSSWGTCFCKGFLPSSAFCKGRLKALTKESAWWYNQHREWTRWSETLVLWVQDLSQTHANVRHCQSTFRHSKEITSSNNALPRIIAINLHKLDQKHHFKHSFPEKRHT